MFSLVEGPLVKIELFPELSETLKNSIVPSLNCYFSPYITALRILLTEQDSKKASQGREKRREIPVKIEHTSQIGLKWEYLTVLCNLSYVNFSFGIFKFSWVFSGFCVGNSENTVLTSSFTVTAGKLPCFVEGYYFCCCCCCSHLKYSSIGAVVPLDQMQYWSVMAIVLLRFWQHQIPILISQWLPLLRQNWYFENYS